MTLRPDKNARFLILSILLGAFFCVPAPARAEMEDHPIVRLRALDKVTARTSTFDVEVDTTVKFGPIYIKPRACRKAPPIEQPEAASFLQIWEVTPRGAAEWIFSGWMFASSPALSSMDHAIYDVWVLDCLPGKDAIVNHVTEDDLADEEESRSAPSDSEELFHDSEAQMDGDSPEDIIPEDLPPED